jgi:hypothetical protein
MNKQTGSRAFIFCQVLAAAMLLAQEAPLPPGAPISLLRAKPDDPANFGFRPLRPGRTAPVNPLTTVFLVTNYTSATVVASLSAIEVKSGSNWVAQICPHGPLLFSVPPGATNAFIPGRPIMELKPHQTAYATIQFSGLQATSGPAMGSLPGGAVNHLPGQPTGAVWRLTVSVQEKLTGMSDASARLTRYASMQARLAAAGVTNAPMNPFSGAYSYLGKPSRVSSEEIPTP